MGDFNHGHILQESLESAVGNDHPFLLPTQDCFLTQHVLEPTRGGNVLDLILTVLKYTKLWVQVIITKSMLI